jgi:hypothetical protein
MQPAECEKRQIAGNFTPEHGQPPLRCGDAAQAGSLEAGRGDLPRVRVANQLLNTFALIPGALNLPAR